MAEPYIYTDPQGVAWVNIDGNWVSYDWYLSVKNPPNAPAGIPGMSSPQVDAYGRPSTAGGSYLPVAGAWPQPKATGPNQAGQLYVPPTNNSPITFTGGYQAAMANGAGSPATQAHPVTANPAAAPVTGGSPVRPIGTPEAAYHNYGITNFTPLAKQQGLLPKGTGGAVVQAAPVDPSKPYKDLASFYGINWNVLKSVYLKDAPAATHSQIINGIESAWWDGQWARLFAQANNGTAPNEQEWKEHYEWKASGGKSRDPLLEPGHNAYMEQWNKLTMPNPPGTQAPAQIPLNGGAKGAVGDLAASLPKAPALELPVTQAPVTQAPNLPYIPTQAPVATELPYLPTVKSGETPIAI